MDRLPGQLQGFVKFVEDLMDESTFDDRAKDKLLQMDLAEGLKTSKRIRLQIKQLITDRFEKLEIEAGEDACKRLCAELAVPLQAVGCDSLLKKYR